MENQTFDRVKAQAITFIYDSLFKDHIYKAKSEQELEIFFLQIREMNPNEAEFFESWFRAFVSVAKNDGKNSSEQFSKALDFLKLEKGKNENIIHTEFFNDQIPAFLQQGFAFFLYINDFESAKSFWEAGAERNLFAKPNSETFYEKFFKKFRPKEQFWVQFPPKMFIDESKATEKCKNDYRTSAQSEDELLNAINEADFQKFSEIAEKIDFNTKKIAGVSPLYYAIQRKGSLLAGSEKFVEDLVQVQVSHLLSQLNLSNLPDSLRERQYFEIYHQVRITYEKSGLGKVMFNDLFGEDSELKEKICEIKKILEIIVKRTSDLDAFTKDAGNKTQTNALLLSAEIGDTETIKLLIDNGANVDKALGHADFGMKYKDGTSIKTEIPNSLVYRMISFAQYEALRFYLQNFKLKAKKSMTEKTKKCDITPLAYLVLNTLYNSRNEEDYNKSKKIVDDFLPVFVEAGAKIEQNTAFGSVKKLLGL